VLTLAGGPARYAVSAGGAAVAVLGPTIFRSAPHQLRTARGGGGSPAESSSAPRLRCDSTGTAAHPHHRRLQSESSGARRERRRRRMRHGLHRSRRWALELGLLAGAGLWAEPREGSWVFFFSDGGIARVPGRNLLSGQMTLPGKNYKDATGVAAFTERLGGSAWTSARRSSRSASSPSPAQRRSATERGRR